MLQNLFATYSPKMVNILDQWMPKKVLFHYQYPSLWFSEKCYMPNSNLLSSYLFHSSYMLCIFESSKSSVIGRNDASGTDTCYVSSHSLYTLLPAT